MEVIAFALGCIVGLLASGKLNLGAKQTHHTAQVEEVTPEDREVREKNKRMVEHMQSLLSYDATQAYKIGGKG